MATDHSHGRGSCRFRKRFLAVAGITLIFGGCASFSPDGGFASGEQTAKERFGTDLQWARNDSDLDTIAKRVTDLLAKPLSADSAVQIALLNNRGLQASFQELGIAEAELVQASRLPNPGFSFARLRRGDEREIERTFTFDLGHLIAMPLTRRVETRRFQQAQVASRERLTRRLGLWGSQTRFVLPDRLPDLPRAPEEQPDIEALRDFWVAQADLDMALIGKPSLSSAMPAAMAADAGPAH